MMQTYPLNITTCAYFWVNIVCYLKAIFIDVNKGAARPKLGGHESPHTEDFPIIHAYL